MTSSQLIMNTSNNNNSNQHDSSRPLYNLSLNPPYQINYRSKRCGKHISLTKRRITFQFGFSNPSAMQAAATAQRGGGGEGGGPSGGECRGLEMEVVCIWSHISGKRSLYFNGREIHSSRAAKGNTHFEYSWGIQGGHVLKFVGNAVGPSEERRRVDPHCRQFDLILDGRSFFDFCKIYELGTSAGQGFGDSNIRMTGVGSRNPLSLALKNGGEDETVTISSSQGSSKENNSHYHSHYDQGYDEPRQITYSYDSNEDEVVDDDEEVMQAPPVSEVQVAPIIDFFDAPPSSTATIAAPQDYSSSDLLASSSTMSPSFGYGVSNSNTATSSSFNASGTYHYHDEFSPRQVPAANHQRSFSAITNEIMCAYNNQINNNSSSAGNNNNNNNNSNNGIPPPSTSTALVVADPDQVDAITKSLKNLVNLDDITSKPFQTLSNQNHSNSNKTTSNKMNNQWNLVGRAPTLSEITSCMNAPSTPSSSTAATSPVKKEIMRSYPAPPQYHQQQQYSPQQQTMMYQQQQTMMYQQYPPQGYPQQQPMMQSQQQYGY